MQLDGLSLENYRGIGTRQRIGPFSRCNFFIGANNSGKSVVLNFLSGHGARLNDFGKATVNHSSLSLATFEAHFGTAAHEVRAGIALTPAHFSERLRLHVHNKCRRDVQEVEEAIGTFSKRLAEDNLVWFDAPAMNLPAASVNQQRLSSAYEHLPQDPERITLQYAVLGEPLPQAYVPHLQQWTARAFSDQLGDPILIPAIRQIGAKGEAYSDFSGKGLIDQLAALHSPRAEESRKREQFAQINTFLRDVSGYSDARIEIPHDRSEVNVSIQGRVMPLSFLGTGIHELIMIATFCTLHEKTIVCIEEPEIHLHPLLQRKLIDYLIQQTNNQYFIATHSASLIDHPDGTIFHVTQENRETKISAAITSIEKVGIWRDLGYKPSDLLQTNFVVWVEGPSDRLYLLHWIAAIAPHLAEGLHFSIMFYGGKLLSHLTGAEDIASDLINLRRLNQHTAIVIDSDKRTADAELNATKRRIIEEFESTGNIAWVTWGREVESYLPSSRIEEALKARYKDFAAVVGNGVYDDRMAFYRNENAPAGKPHQADKMAVARHICQSPPDLAIDDLQEKLVALTSAIMQANGLRAALVPSQHLNQPE